MDQQTIDILKKQLGAHLIQTHISWILLTREYVYKIKKPVRFSFLDFSTLKKRKFCCEEEVRLNRRLSPNVYLGVVPIKDGGCSFDGKRKIIEYAVKMRKLPAYSKMDVLLKKNKITPKHIKSIARVIVDFHKKIKTIHERRYSSPRMVKEQIDDLGGVKQTVNDVCGLKFRKKIDFILRKCDGFINENSVVMKKRQKEGKIKDCHGDLHSGNIFITNKNIHIFDCIEFNKEFRYIDVASEVAFVAMDLDAFGKEDLGKIFVNEYVKLSRDKRILDLLDLYKCYRANVRAKVAALAVKQEGSKGQKKNIKKYLTLCEKYAKLL